MGARSRKNLGGLSTFRGVQTGVAPGVAVTHVAFVPIRVRFSARPRHVDSGFVQSAEHQILTLEMGVRLSQPELRPAAAHVNRRFPEHSAHSETTATRCRRGVTTEYDDDEAHQRLVMPLLRRWSARSAENREVLVRFQGVARHARAASVRRRIAAALPP